MDMDVNHGMYEIIHLSIYSEMVYIMCRFVLQCVAVRCCVLLCVAVCCCVLQYLLIWMLVWMKRL